MKIRAMGLLLLLVGCAKAGDPDASKELHPESIHGFTCHLNLTAEDMDRARSYGANTLRLMLMVDDVFLLDKYHDPVTGAITTAENIDRIERFILMAREKGFTTILDLHETPGLVRWNVWEDYRLWDPNPNQGSSFETVLVETWRLFSQRFASLPYDAVVYEMLNEPAPNNGEKGSSEDFGDRWDALQSRLYRVIRENDANHVIIGSPPYNWRSTAFGGEWTPSEELIADGKVWMSLHHYSPHDYTFQSEPPYAPYPGGIFNGLVWQDVVWDRDMLFAIFDPVRDFQKRYPSLPILITEFSVKKNVPDAANWLTDVIASFEDIDVGYIYHSFDETEYLHDLFGIDESPWDLETGSPDRLEVIKDAFLP